MRYTHFADAYFQKRSTIGSPQLSPPRCHSVHIQQLRPVVHLCFNLGIPDDLGQRANLARSLWPRIRALALPEARSGLPTSLPAQHHQQSSHRRAPAEFLPSSGIPGHAGGPPKGSGAAPAPRPAFLRRRGGSAASRRGGRDRSDRNPLVDRSRGGGVLLPTPLFATAATAPCEPTGSGPAARVGAPLLGTRTTRPDSRRPRGAFARDR